MAKNTFLSFSTTPGDNTDIGGIGIQGTNLVSNFDNALRTFMAILRGDLDNGVVFVSKGSGYTAVAGDNNAFYEFTGTATLALTAAATLAADWHMIVFANGGVVTVDPDASELINGASTLTIANGDAAYIICTGSAFRAIIIPTSSRIKTLITGAALPSSDIGPIWHPDYADVMTWQTYSANGASYAGYASVDVGMPALEGQSTPRTGYLKRNGASVSKTTYAALWNWAVHNGRSIALGSWTAGPFVFADNGDGTFKLPDQRGEFERLWDDSRGIDSGRALGSAQTYLTAAVYGRYNSGTTVVASALNGGGAPSRVSLAHDSWDQSGNMSGNVFGAETRPRNVAFSGVIKF